MFGVILTLQSVILNITVAASELTTFKTGKDLDRALAVKISWSSISSELGDQLRDLQQQTQVLILRDRRIDPHRRISVETGFVPRVQVLRQISATVPDTAFCVTDDFVCVGPAEAIHRLPILLSHNTDQVNSLRKKIDAASFRQLTAKIDASWEQLSEPRQILLDDAMIAGVVIRNPDAIPHDLWAEGHLPRMAFTNLATVILNQFDLTFSVASDGAEFTIVPIDPEEALEHSYIVGSDLKSSIAAAWRNKAPGIEIKWTGSNAAVTTTLQQHASLYALLQESVYSVTTSDSTSAIPRSSIRTTNYQIKAERATIRQLIDFFRREGVTIEVVDEESPEVLAILKESVQLETFKERQRGLKLFPLIFGMHFKQVDVRDDRVVLSRE